MATFVQIQGHGGRLVYVNLERINYIRAEGENTMLYFDKDQSLLVEEPVAEVRGALDPSRYKFHKRCILTTDSKSAILRAPRPSGMNTRPRLDTTQPAKARHAQKTIPQKTAFRLGRCINTERRKCHCPIQMILGPSEAEFGLCA